MPKLYEYYGLIILFYSNEHGPIHVHGKYQGKDAQVGNYVYHVEYINGIGEITEKTDLVSLVR